MQIESISPQLVLHVVAGSAGLGLGLAVLLVPEGGLRHRRWGRIFAMLAGLVVLSAVLALWRGDAVRVPLLVSLTLAAGYQLLGALRALALRARGPGWIDAVLALAALASAALIARRYDPQHSAMPAEVAYVSLGYTALIALYDLSRHAWSQHWLQRVRRIDHGLKMAGVFFAMLAAACGNLLPHWQPWSIVAPNIAAGLTFALILRRHRHRRRVGA